MVASHRFRVVDGPLSAEAATQRHKWLRLTGRDAASWRLFELDWSSDMESRELQVPAEARQYYKPTSSTGKILFVEGPNVGVSDNWRSSLRDGWSVTLRQLPWGAARRPAALSVRMTRWVGAWCSSANQSIKCRSGDLHKYSSNQFFCPIPPSFGGCAVVSEKSKLARALGESPSLPQFRGG